MTQPFGDIWGSTPMTWDEAALRFVSDGFATAQLAGCGMGAVAPSPAYLIDGFEAFEGAFDTLDEVDLHQLYDLMLLNGTMGLLMVDPTATAEGVVKVLVGKQRDYGHTNITKFNHLGLRVRMWDKLARLQNLQKRGGKATNESVRDTWLDIVGYSTIGLMLTLGWFGLDLAEDTQS